MRNPWKTATAYGMGMSGIALEVTTAEARLALVERYDPVKLKQVIAWPETQKSVKLAAQKRLRKLKRENAANR